MRSPLSFRVRNRNCSQEAGSVPTCFIGSIHSMESRFTLRPVSIAGWLLMLMLLVLEWLAGLADHVGAPVTVTLDMALKAFAEAHGYKPMPRRRVR